MKEKYLIPIPVGMPPDIRPAPFHKTDACLRHCIDFALPPGTPILASRDGIVIVRESRFSKNFTNTEDVDKGNGVILRHADGEISVYAHVQWRSVRVARGEFVRQGQEIAKSGQTGYATYPHLHFGIYDKGGRNRKVHFGR